MYAVRFGQSKFSQPFPPCDGAANMSLPSILWRHKLLFLFWIVVCVGAASVYLYRAKPLYTATARVCVRPIGPKMLGETESAHDWR